jgi:UPF0716 protein FxsA
MRWWPIVLVVGAIAELFVFVQVSNAIGFGWALLALVAVSVIGLSLVKRAGLGVVRRIGEQANRREPIAGNVLDGFLLLVAGVFVAIPGFISGALGLLLLLPPLRHGLRSTAERRVRSSPRIIQATYRVEPSTPPVSDRPVDEPPKELP